VWRTTSTETWSYCVDGTVQVGQSRPHLPRARRSSYPHQSIPERGCSPSARHCIPVHPAKLALNLPNDAAIDVVLVPRNDPETGWRVMSSIEAHKLGITRMASSKANLRALPSGVRCQPLPVDERTGRMLPCKRGARQDSCWTASATMTTRTTSYASHSTSTASSRVTCRRQSIAKEGFSSFTKQPPTRRTRPRRRSTPWAFSKDCAPCSNATNCARAKTPAVPVMQTTT
jgi:hypothetical protein